MRREEKYFIEIVAHIKFKLYLQRCFLLNYAKIRDPDFK